MSRSLRSSTRRKKLQAQHIQQVNRTLRRNINNAIESNIENFNQMEFLSLFGLTRTVQSNGIQKVKAKERIQHIIEANRRKSKRKSPMVNTNTTDCNHNENEILKIRYKLGKHPCI